MLMTPHNRYGFTIVELLIVIVVIGILAGITIAGFNGVQRTTHIAKLQSDLRNASQYLRITELETGSFPTDLSNYTGESENVTVEYTNSGTSYCLTASSNDARTNYFYDSSSGTMIEGKCAGHIGYVDPGDTGGGGGGPSGPDPATSWSAISMGGFHDCAISNGAGYCWGGPGLGNSWDGMGQGVREVQPVPVPILTSGVLAGKTVEEISAGSVSSCAIADGLLHCWGSNTANTGVLARSLTSSTNSPALSDNTGVLAGRNLSGLSVGGQHGCVIGDGLAFCWGAGTSGSLGRGTIGNSNLPVAVSTSGVLNGLTVTKISASHSGSSGAYTCAVANAQAFCWGDGANGNIGNGSTADQTSPVAVSTAGVLAGKSVTDISARGNHTCAIADGEAFCWGWGTGGRIGEGGTTNRTSPVAVSTAGVLAGVELTRIVAGASGSCTLGENRVFCWGNNGLGIFGNGTTTNSNVPVEVPLSGILAGRQIVDISMYGSVCILLSDGEVYCWGDNSSTGPIGTGGTDNVLTPQRLISPWL